MTPHVMHIAEYWSIESIHISNTSHECQKFLSFNQTSWKSLWSNIVNQNLKPSQIKTGTGPSCTLNIQTVLNYKKVTQTARSVGKSHYRQNITKVYGYSVYRTRPNGTINQTCEQRQQKKGCLMRYSPHYLSNSLQCPLICHQIPSS